MRKVEKMSEREMRFYLKPVIDLLRIARCPNLGCLDGRIPHQIGAEEWEAEQCQWCFERQMLLQGLE